MSTNESVWGNFVIERAIDGGTGAPETCRCCTAIKRPTFFQLNLPHTYFVKRVVLQGRTDVGSILLKIYLCVFPLVVLLML